MFYRKSEKSNEREKQKVDINKTVDYRQRERERERESTASGLPMSLATVEVASERIEEVSTPSRPTLVEMFRQGIFSHFLFVFSPFLSLSLTL